MRILRQLINAERLRHIAEYVAFRIIVCLVDILPVRTSIRLAESMAWVIHHGLPKKLTRYAVARDNIRQAFGARYSEREIDDIIRRMWVHLFRVVVEIVQVRRKLRLYNCADVVQFNGRDESVRLFCSGRPVIVLSGHFGNWEIASGTFGMFGFPMGVVARDLDNPYLHRWFETFRRQTGHRLISKRGGGSDMLGMLERRGYLALMGDQDAGSTGLFVDFFGKPASTFKSIALLALEYRAYICVGYAIRLPDDFESNRWVRYEIGHADFIDTEDFQGPDAVREVTQRFTTALERAIALAPEQYFWVHRRWKSVPKQRVRRKRAA
ncbi:MAG TPA: lysophospholipid acyltransferase family protein [Planctomycetaceae bacterium]|nr:lysophospholipid acyltransferase family protein [Planctomycetaceae bacterium]